MARHFAKGAILPPGGGGSRETLDRRQANTVEDSSAWKPVPAQAVRARSQSRNAAPDQAVVWSECLAGAAHGANASKHRYRGTGQQTGPNGLGSAGQE